MPMWYKAYSPLAVGLVGGDVEGDAGQRGDGEEVAVVDRLLVVRPGKPQDGLA